MNITSREQISYSLHLWNTRREIMLMENWRFEVLPGFKFKMSLILRIISESPNYQLSSDSKHFTPKNKKKSLLHRTRERDEHLLIPPTMAKTNVLILSVKFLIFRLQTICSMVPFEGYIWKSQTDHQFVYFCYLCLDFVTRKWSWNSWILRCCT